ncbi:peptide upstream protein [Actinidia rufa]|uniref:Peptide upstream protein n=1 Tax=Actinidia rufa TaxID=165716 RepID=A0A7J0DAZ3_9ERIC|nr:peptide upstream protein [Actinidia rufa]
MRGSGELTKGRRPRTGRRAKGVEEEAVELDAVGEDEVGVAVGEGVGKLDEAVVVGPQVKGAGCEDGDQMELCVGEGSASAVSALRELGFSNAFGADRHPSFSLLRKHFVYELDFKDDYFDFVFSRALDKVSFPALLVLEIEHVLQPSGTSAMLVGASSFYSGGLIRSATPVASFLKSSSVVHVCGIRSLTLVIFKKRFDNVAFFQHYRLPSKCRSITNNKRFIEFMEPLDENSGPIEMKLSYLPEFMNISSRNRFIYINIGAGELVNSSISEMFKPFYPMEPRAFNIYVVDHNTSVLSYVKNPIVTFVYHSGLAGDKAITSLSSDDDDYLSAPLDEEEFDFIRWLKRTVSDKGFVILVMNARAVELKILFELFESGAICHVDELFLGCSVVADCTSAMCGDCASFFRGLRKSGVFVHCWLGN